MLLPSTVGTESVLVLYRIIPPVQGDGTMTPRQESRVVVLAPFYR